MNIDRLQPQTVYKSFSGSSTRSEEAGADKKAPESVSADRVEISTESSSLNQARGLVSQSGIAVPEEQADRNERIEQLKEQVQSGTYAVSSRDIARSILSGNRMDLRA